MKRFQFLKNVLNISAERYFKSAGKLFIFEGDYESALILINKTLELDPANVKAMVLKGDILFCLNRDLDALAILDKALSVNGGYVEAHISKAGVLEALGRFREALNCCRRAFSLLTKAQGYLLPTLYEQKLILLIYLKKFNEAKQLLNEATHVLPNDESQLLFQNYAGILNEGLRKRTQTDKQGIKQKLGVLSKKAD